ncbi:MAG: hypothetical protein WCB67_09355 [Solirubrobacteraceae bacterium]
MWLAFPVIVIVIFALGASIVSGGIFTIVVLPLAVVIAVVALVFSLWGRATGSRHTSSSPEVAPLPSSQHSNSAPAPGSPDELVDARRAQQ